MVYFLGGLLLFIHVRASRPRISSQQYHLGNNLPFVHYNIWDKCLFVAKQPNLFGAPKGNHKFYQNAVLVLVKLCKKMLLWNAKEQVNMYTKLLSVVDSRGPGQG